MRITNKGNFYLTNIVHRQISKNKNKFFTVRNGITKNLRKISLSKDSSKYKRNFPNKIMKLKNIENGKKSILTDYSSDEDKKGNLIKNIKNIDLLLELINTENSFSSKNYSINLVNKDKNYNLKNDINNLHNINNSNTHIKNKNKFDFTNDICYLQKEIIDRNISLKTNTDINLNFVRRKKKLIFNPANYTNFKYDENYLKARSLDLSETNNNTSLFLTNSVLGFNKDGNNLKSTNSILSNNANTKQKDHLKIRETESDIVFNNNFSKRINSFNNLLLGSKILIDPVEDFLKTTSLISINKLYFL